jgi:hypothetical protein
MIVWHLDTSSGARFDWAADEEHLRQQLIEYNNTVLNAYEPDDQLASDATLEEAIELIEERESFSREHMSGVYRLDSRERDTVLAALRLFDAWRCGQPIDRLMIEDIETNGGQHPSPPLSGPDLDSLAERLNT